MTLAEFVTAMMPILDSKVVSAVLSAVLGTGLGLWTYRRQAKERLAASVSWSWTMTYAGKDELPFLVVQNMGNVPSYITSARYLRGNIIRRLQQTPHVVVHEDIEEDSYPKVVPAAGAGHFRAEQGHVERIAATAKWHNRLLHRLGRPYVWIEVRTIAGKRLVISARDVICVCDRPGWW